jgi:trans-aconitate methyltransferase
MAVIMKSEDYQKYLSSSRTGLWSEDGLRQLSKFLDMHQVNSICDYGCGTGEFTKILETISPPDCSIVGIDIDEQLLKVAKQSALRDSTTFFRHDVNNLPTDWTHDVSCCQTLLMNLSNPVEVCKIFKEHTNSGGLIFAVEPDNSVRTFYSSVEEEIELVRKSTAIAIEQTAGSRHLNCGPTVASWFAKTGLRDIDVMVYTVLDKVLPPNYEYTLSHIGETGQRLKAKSDVFKNNLNELIGLATIAEKKTKKQIENNEYVRVGTYSLFVSKGRVP